MDFSVQNNTAGVLVHLCCYAGDLRLVFLQILVSIQPLTQYHLCRAVNVLSDFVRVQQIELKGRGRQQETEAVQLGIILHFYFPENIITKHN